MFERLLQIHKVIVQDRGDSSPIQSLNEGLEPSYGYGLAICFTRDGDYAGIKITEGNSDVVYISGPPNGYDFTAISKYPGKAENVTGRLLRWLVDFTASPEAAVNRSQLEILTERFNTEQIATDIQVELGSLDTRQVYPYVYLAWLDDSIINPLYLDKDVQDFAVSRAFSNYGRVKNVNAVVQNQSCSICGTVASKLYGNFSLIACYNLDKRGFITGGLDYRSSVKNFPVCEPCVIGISSGWNYANRHLRFPLAGERYLLLPQVRGSEVRDLVRSLLENREKGESLKQSALETITNSEREILDAIAEVSKDTDAVTLSMIFFEEIKAAWRITAEINVILPSRINKIYGIKRLVEADDTLTLSKNHPFHFTLATLRQFTGVRVDKQSQKQFLTYVDRIFSGGIIERDVFLHAAVTVILSAYKRNPDFSSFTVRDAWATYRFLMALGVLTPSQGGITVADEDDVYSQFMKTHQDFFDGWEKRIAFLTGCYVNAVAYVQQKKLNNDPFLKKVRGVKMDRNRLQRLYSEVQSKLRQYRAYGLVAKSLDPALATAWVHSGSTWKVSDDEATFAFTLGLSLSGKIRQEDKTADESAEIKD